MLPKRVALNRGVYFVRGAKGAAIYDLDVGTVYSVSSIGAQVLDLALQGLTPLEIACRVSVGLGEIVAFLDSLVLEHGVGYWHEGRAGAQEDERDLAPLEPKFHSLILELTQRCNLQCVHCYAESGPKPNAEELGVEDWRQLIRDAAELGCRHVTFTGGEPLLAKDLLCELIEYASEKGLRTVVFTNATLITSEISELFCRFGVRAAVSLYGPNERVHDRVTRVPDSFKATVNNVLNLRMRGVLVGIAMTVMRENQDYVEETERFARDRLNAEFVAAPILPIGRGRLNDLVASTESFLRVASGKLTRAASEGRIRLPVRVMPIFPRVYRAKFGARSSGTCWSGCLCITSTGDAIPCPAARQVVLDHVKRSRLQAIISSDAVEQAWKFTKDHVQVCKDCEYRYACQDCPAAVLATGGSLDEKPAWCTYNPYAGEWQSDALARLSDRTGKVIARCLHPCPADSLDGEQS
ncbi:MAG: Antilisterial bacteriocin subtilosin biosynthesis protein AlbA [Firmicutes bacterium]|nr:Antilisterial bacteriocin subtilosin biosynthesis protein AlbA [Bacillota bacterium]